MSTTTDTTDLHIRIPTLADMLTAAAAALPCDHCDAEPTIRVFGDDARYNWEAGISHDVDCPASRWSQRHAGDCCADA